ncbi:MAG: AsmA family protein, partial [Pseudomonadota bacterium]
MRIAKILMIVGVAVVVLVVGAIVVLMSMDFNQYKPEIAAEVKKATGRDFDIEGDLRLNLLSFNPGLEVDGVKFANAAWGSRPEMATIKRFEVKVSLLPLLSGSLNVDSVVIEGADILVERNREGQGNYEFLAAEPDQKDGAAKSGSGSAGETSGGGFPSLAIEEITIENSKVTYKDDATGQTLALGIDRLSVEPESGDRLDLEIKGNYNDAAFTVAGKTGLISDLLGSSDPWPVSLKASLGGATVDIDGRIADPKAVSGIDVTLSVAGDDLSKMSAFAGGPVPPLGPYSLAAKIAGSLDKTIELNDLSAKVGGSDLSGKASASVKGKPKVQATLTSTLINLDDFTKGAGTNGSSASGGGQGSAGSGGGGGGGASDGKVFPNDPLPVEGLKAADANIDLTVTKLIAGKIAIDNLKSVVALSNGDLAVSPLTADVAKGKINGSINLRASQATP